MLLHNTELCSCFVPLEQNIPFNKEGYTLWIAAIGNHDAIIATKHGLDLASVLLLPGIRIHCELVSQAIAQAEQVLFALFNSF